MLPGGCISTTQRPGLKGGRTLDNVQGALVLALGILVGVEAGLALDVDERSREDMSALRRIGQYASGLGAYPLGRLWRKSRRGPGFSKLVTRNQLVWRFSRGPELLATAYLMISRPVLVAWSSGVSARLPTMVMRATPRAGVELKLRAAMRGTATERRRKADILAVGGGVGGDVMGFWMSRGCLSFNLEMRVELCRVGRRVRNAVRGFSTSPCLIMARAGSH
jgi:hypothetical protein